ncbi:Phosphopantetheine attachment site [Micromonospora pattaloongensis]|uniref:Phosphopantetheine attachment site n=1 Tax=Micromonospora pattaloongensis TaxID=405436 RepID=A0A1H3JWW6_9ACTN|nr:phosphopantetheine-binding protein [Micromonospora pattaloongensis]SDY43995.1 Phosphopantetheine attachment site [Micromonospora pattaloongensis]
MKGALTQTETAIAAIWAEVLGLDVITRSDDFFELGGDSLLATKVVVRIRRAWSVRCTVQLIIDTPVLSEFAAAVDELAGTRG